MDRLPGFRDFFPLPVPQKDQWAFAERRFLFETWRGVLRAYGFKEYDGPPLEPLELFTRKSGEEIVGQLYNFVDKGDRKVAMRPEMTPTLARMVATSERQYKKPMKWFSIPQLFRYERKQKGRLREHFQLNADIIGEAGVSADAEVIALLIDVLRAVGLTNEDFVVRLSSREAWQRFYRDQGGEESDEYAFFQVIDKLERMPAELAEEKLASLGVSYAAVQRHIQEGAPTEELQTILNDLGARGLASYVRVDYGIIRGLAYYTGVVFEAFDRKGDFRAIAGGGRYDRLIDVVSDGKVDLPALGFGMGDVVLTELLRVKGLLPKPDRVVDVYCLIEEETLRTASLRLIQALRDLGVGVDFSMVAQKPNKQFKQATELNARWVATLRCDAEGANPMVHLKDLSDRSEEQISLEDCARVVQRYLNADNAA